MKTNFMRAKPEDLSSMDAVSYGKRFMQYMSNQLFKDDEKL